MADIPLEKLVSARIKGLRVERGMTQEQLCERADISIDAVTRIESGTRVPTLDTLQKIASALGSTVSELLHSQPPKPTKMPAAIRRLVTLIEDEPAEVQEAVEEIVRAALKLTKPKRTRRR